MKERDIEKERDREEERDREKKKHREKDQKRKLKKFYRKNHVDNDCSVNIRYN